MPQGNYQGGTPSLPVDTTAINKVMPPALSEMHATPRPPEAKDVFGGANAYADYFKLSPEQQAAVNAEAARTQAINKQYQNWQGRELVAATLGGLAASEFVGGVGETFIGGSAARQFGEGALFGAIFEGAASRMPLIDIAGIPLAVQFTSEIVKSPSPMRALGRSAFSLGGAMAGAGAVGLAQGAYSGYTVKRTEAQGKAFESSLVDSSWKFDVKKLGDWNLPTSQKPLTFEPRPEQATLTGRKIPDVEVRRFTEVINQPVIFEGRGLKEKGVPSGRLESYGSVEFEGLKPGQEKLTTPNLFGEGAKGKLSRPLTEPMRESLLSSEASTSMFSERGFGLITKEQGRYLENAPVDAFSVQQRQGFNFEDFVKQKNKRGEAVTIKRDISEQDNLPSFFPEVGKPGNKLVNGRSYYFDEIKIGEYTVKRYRESVPRAQARKAFGTERIIRPPKEESFKVSGGGARQKAVLKKPKLAEWEENVLPVSKEALKAAVEILSFYDVRPKMAEVKPELRMTDMFRPVEGLRLKGHAVPIFKSDVGSLSITREKTRLFNTPVSAMKPLTVEKAKVFNITISREKTREVTKQGVTPISITREKAALRPPIATTLFSPVERILPNFPPGFTGWPGIPKTPGRTRIPAVPLLSGEGLNWGRKGKGREIQLGRGFKYKPSLGAIAFDIKGKQPKRLTGLEIRPIIGRGR